MNELDITIHLGKMDVGNNHEERHLLDALKEKSQNYQCALMDRVGEMPFDNVSLTYYDKFKNFYVREYCVGELFDMLKSRFNF